MTSTAGLLAALMALTFGFVTVRVHQPPRFPPYEVPGVAWRTCEAGRSTITLMPTGVTLRDVAWEYAGALDCADDGAANGSTVPGCDVGAYLARYPESRAYSALVLATSGAEAQHALDASECAAAAIVDDGRAWR